MQLEHHNINGIVPNISEVTSWALSLGFGLIVRPAPLEHTANMVVSTGSKQLETALTVALNGKGWAFTRVPIKRDGDKATFTILVRITDYE